jgi:Ca-activated chloride channel family protein
MTVVFFMSDGEITDGSELTSFQPLAELTDGGAVLGYGTEKGATMSVGYTLRDPNTMQDAVSCMDEGNLKQIAGDLNVEYIHPATGAGLKPLLQKIIQSSSTVVSDKKGVTYIDIAWKFAIPAAILLLMEVFMLIYRDRL